MNTKKVERQGKELKFCRGASPSTSMRFKVTQCDSMRLNATQCDSRLLCLQGIEDQAFGGNGPRDIGVRGGFLNMGPQ